MKFMVTALGKNTSTLPINAMTFFQLRNVIASTSPYVVYTKKHFDPEHFDYRLFFDGDSSTVRFITESPMGSNLPAIIELSLIEDRLIYKESPLYAPDVNYLAPKLSAVPYTLTLMNDLKNASLSYETNTTSATTLKGQIPQQIKLTFERQGRKNEYIFEIPINSTQQIGNIRTTLEVV